MSETSVANGLLAGRVALLTGASGGIGRVLALEMARQGAQLLLTSNEGVPLAATLEEVRLLSPESVAMEVDVTSQTSLEALVQLAMQRFGKIDILVNNAGITRDGLLIRMSDADWNLVLSINLTSVFHLTRSVVKHMMKARYGRIINLASVVGLTGNPGQANYTASKAGLIAFSKSVAREVATRNITVNCVAPGFIATPMTDKLKPEARQGILSQVPLGREGTPDDVARAVIFLASDWAGYITGETLHVNGGMYMA